LRFRRDIKYKLLIKLRRILRDFLEYPDFSRFLEIYGPVFRRPLELGRFRLRLAFSAGEAAKTALLHGWFCLFLGFLYLPPAINKGKIVLEPRFLSRREVSLDCDISLALPAAVFLFRMISLSVRIKRLARARRTINQPRHGTRANSPAGF
jgi:hypothetical protein